MLLKACRLIVITDQIDGVLMRHRVRAALTRFSPLQQLCPVEAVASCERSAVRDVRDRLPPTRVAGDSLPGKPRRRVALRDLVGVGLLAREVVGVGPGRQKLDLALPLESKHRLADRTLRLLRHGEHVIHTPVCVRHPSPDQFFCCTIGSVSCDITVLHRAHAVARSRASGVTTAVTMAAPSSTCAAAITSCAAVAWGFVRSM